MSHIPYKRFKVAEGNAAPNSPLQAKLGICDAWCAIPALVSRHPSVSGTSADQRISQVEIAAGELLKQSFSRSEVMRWIQARGFADTRLRPLQPRQYFKNLMSVVHVYRKRERALRAIILRRNLSFADAVMFFTNTTEIERVARRDKGLLRLQRGIVSHRGCNP